MNKITFKTDLDNTEIEKDLKEVERKIKKSESELEKSQTAKLPLIEQSKELGVQLDIAKEKLEQLNAESKKISLAMQPGSDPASFIDAASRKSQVESDLKSQQKEVDTLQKKWDSVNTKVDNYNAKIQSATASIAESKTQAAELSSKLSKGKGNLSGMFDSASKSAKHLEKRIIGLGKRVLFFSLITAGLRKVRQYMSTMLMQNEEYTAQLAKLKGAMLTAFQPLYETILPAVIGAMKVLTAITQVLAYTFSVLFGKGNSAESAKNMYDKAHAIGAVGAAAKKATKALAGFDEIQKVGSSDTGGGGGGVGGGAVAPDFSAFDTGPIKEKIEDLTVFMGGATLALGTILAFSGANIPLGLGLMVLGAMEIAAAVKENWGELDGKVRKEAATLLTIVGGLTMVIGIIIAFACPAKLGIGLGLILLGATEMASAVAIGWDVLPNKIKKIVGIIETIAGTALLALGIILCCTGVKLPLGVALMAAGALALAQQAYLNWGLLPNKVQKTLSTILAIAGASVFVIGLVILCTGANPALGIGLMIAGAAAIGTAVAVNWHFIQDKVKEIWQDVKNYWKSNIAPIFTVDWWKEKFSSISKALKERVKDGINAAIELVNRFIGWLNSKMHISWKGLNIAGHQIFNGGSMTLFKIPNIPYLAKGAVLPANKPFLSVVGDQTHGTNIEAPLETIQEAVANVMGDMSSGMMAGFEASVGVQREILEAVLGINIGDDMISNAVARYNRKMNVVNGGTL